MGRFRETTKAEADHLERRDVVEEEQITGERTWWSTMYDDPPTTTASGGFFKREWFRSRLATEEEIQRAVDDAVKRLYPEYDSRR